MSARENATIEVKGVIDAAVARKITAKVRAALHTKVKTINLVFEKDTDITSAAFMAFLIATAKHMRENNRMLNFKNANERIKILLKMSCLSNGIME